MFLIVKKIAEKVSDSPFPKYNFQCNLIYVFYVSQIRVILMIESDSTCSFRQAQEWGE